MPSAQLPVLPSDEANDLAAALRARLEGEVRFDRGARALYATDGSNYRQVPIGVVLPRSLDDVIQTVAVCRDFGAPVLSRGAGTSLAGQCCNVAVVIDWSMHLNHVLEVNARDKWLRAQPGAICDTVRKAAGAHGTLTFGPDPASHNRCTIGGMMGNNSCGVHSQMAGKTVDNVETMDILTYDGLRLHCGWMTTDELEREAAQPGRRGEIFNGLKGLVARYSREIVARYPSIPRRVSGYNLDALVPDADGRFNLARALIGSEGTLVTILEAQLKLVYNPPFQSLLVLGYDDIYQAADAVPGILLKSKPIGLEAIDELIVENIKKKDFHVEYLNKLPEGKGFLLVQFGGESKQDADDQARELLNRIKRRESARDSKLYDDPEDERAVWRVRESGLAATTFVPGEPLTWEGWEDSAVAPERLGKYLRDLRKLYARYGYRGTLYGHFGMGCVHTRVNFDLMSAPGIRDFRSFLDEAADLVVSYGGSLSGEHGDGQARAELLPRMFGNDVVQAFREFKAIWDPRNKMNPHKVVDPYGITENLRLGADYRPWEPSTHFRFPDDGGRFSHATLRCVGVGKCRREGTDEHDDDVMCPSYMVTREEEHSTRGRAHLLWEMLHGFESDHEAGAPPLPPSFGGEGGNNGSPIRDGWRSEEVKASLDLCLACKGCKSECPVNVDMATYKAEFLSHYYEGRARPRQAYAFGYIDRWARLASLWPGLVNLVTATPGLRDIAKWAAGMPVQRRVPQFAPQTFVAWWQRRAPRHSSGQKVTLWPDTFNNHFFPDTLQAAVEVLEAAGCEVEVPQQHICCGRPLYDYGLLDDAKEYLERVFAMLEPQIAAGIPIVVLEPSCAAVLRDEVRGLFPDRPEAERLMQQTFLLSEFLEKKLPAFQLPPLRRKALVHGHCHHKAIMKFKDEESLLERMQLEAEYPATGCCGMAGSFGFEADKYDVSVAVGERALLPKVREADPSTLILADGFSCREQIAQLTDRRALHVAEVLQAALHDGATGDLEREITARREAAARRSRVQAAAILGGAATAIAVALWWRSRD